MEQNLSVNAKRIEQLIGVKTDSRTGSVQTQSPSLEKGERFTANIKDIKPNQIVLSMPGGKVLTARAEAMPDARIGDDAIFQVKESFKGQVLLEMLKPDKALPHAGIVREALLAADLPLSVENYFLLERLISEGLPIDAESLQKALFFRHAGEGLDLDTVIFLMKESFPADFKTVETLDRFLSQQVKIGRDLTLISDDILRLGNEKFKTEILLVMGKEVLGVYIDENNTDTAPLKEALLLLKTKLIDSGQNLHAELKEASDAIKMTLSRNSENLLKPETVNTFFKTAVNMLKSLRTEADIQQKNLQTAEADKSVLDQLMDRVDRNLENIRFMNRIHETKQYLQLPVTLSESSDTAEIHVFKGKKSTDKNYVSALLSLTYPELGLVETFMGLTGRTLTLDFSVADDRIMKLVKANQRILRDKLAESGYNIGRISFGTSEEPAKITANSEKQSGETGRRYSFDMRI